MEVRPADGITDHKPYVPASANAASKDHTVSLGAASFIPGEGLVCFAEGAKVADHLTDASVEPAPRLGKAVAGRAASV
jgi:hypothetical protein